MIPNEAQPHLLYLKHVQAFGTPAELAQLEQDLRVMRELWETFPGSRWLPMEDVVLTDYLFNDFSLRLARYRIREMIAKRGRHKQGATHRNVAEEQESIRGQLALQACLGLPFGKPDTFKEAERVGNCGRGQTAFVPFKNIFRHHLIVDPPIKDSLTCWLVVPERGLGNPYYKVTGWIRAKDAKQKQWFRIARGGQSKAFWIPPEMLSTVPGWWEQWNE